LPPLQIKTLSAIAVACTLAALVGGAIAGRAETRKLEALRREFPAVSLADRLAFERRERNANSAPITLATRVDNDLASWERQNNGGNYRAPQLARLHAREYENFIRATGFGLVRMLRPTAENLGTAALRDIAFEDTERTQQGARHGNWSAWDQRDEAGDLDSLHSVSRSDFLHADGFGAPIGPLGLIAGFVEHAFHHPPTSAFKDPVPWTIERLELVSLLKFDEPRIYVLDHLPRMDQLSSDDATTRALDEFEADALKQLRTQQDVVVDDHEGRVRMLGSLRAGTQCLDCHAAQRGALLGAFSYVLSAR
jgi:hypothetical protein